MLKEKEIDSLLRKVFLGEITTRNLPKKLYQGTINKLMRAVNSAFDFEGRRSELYQELKANIYVFSGAKTYTQIKDISSLILDGTSLRPWNEFKPLALAKYNEYNVSYLATEYETAVGQAQTAVKWQQIIKNPNTLLRREAVMDSNTSVECKYLNNIVAPANSPFWAKRTPLTHFRCRCILVEIGEGDAKESSPQAIERAIKVTDHINPLFKGNPGIDKVVFNSSHPYFDIDKKDKNFARQNFGL